MNKILEKNFITTKDLKELTGFGTSKCKKILSDIKEEMLNDNKFVPFDKKLCIPTNEVRKKLGI